MERSARDDDRLAGIERKLDRLCLLAEQQEERNARVARTLYGDNGTPGMVVRLDRLEQAAERGRWLMRAVVGAVVTVFVTTVWAILAG